MRKFTLILLSISFLSCLFHGCRLDEVAPATLADFNVLGGPVHIQGESITFENTSSYYTAGASFTWDFGDTIMEIDNTSSVTYTYDTTGTYTIILTAHKAIMEGEDAYSTTKDTTITISAIALPDPIAAFAAIPDSSPCIVPCLVRFVDQSQDHDSTMNVWDFGDGKGSSTETSPTYAYDSIGVYMPKLTVRNAQGMIDSVDSVAIIVINPEEPMPEARFSIDNPNACTVAPCTFVLNNTSTDADSFLWDFYADGSIDTITTNTDPFPFYTIEWGTIEVKLTAKNSSGNMDMDTVSVFLGTPTLPIAEFFIVTDSCEAPCNAEFKNSSDFTTSFIMNYGDGSPESPELDSAIFHHLYETPGTYTVTMTALRGGTPYSDTYSDTIHIISPAPDPIANFTYDILGNTVNFTNSSQNASSYVWNFGDTNSSADTDPQHTYANPGSYPVQLTAHNTSGFDTITKMVTILAVCADSTYEKTLGSSDSDQVLAIAAHPDGGFVMAGSTEIGVTEVGWIVHVDACGDQVWAQTYNISGLTSGRFNSITPRADNGGFIAGGYVNNSADSTRRGWILKINNDGTEVWNQAVTYLNWKSIHIEEVVANPIGGYLAVGRSSELPGTSGVAIQDRHGFLIKINDGGMSAMTAVEILENQSVTPYVDSYFRAIHIHSNGDAYLAGHLRPDSMNIDWQARFVRYNLTSNSMIADVAFGDLNEDEQLFDIIENPAGNLVMCGSHNSTTFWMREMNPLGGFVREDNIILSESRSIAENITMTQSGTQYALTGFAGVNGNRQTFLITVDLNMNGPMINRRFGFSGNDRGREILLAPDGGYFIGGETSINGNDAFYIRTDINGLTQ